MKKGVIIFFAILIFLVVLIWYFQNNKNEIYSSVKELGIIKSNPILKVKEGQGLTSCMSVRLSDFCKKNKLNHINEIDSSQQFELYKDNPEQDVSKILFQPYNQDNKVPYSDFDHSWQFRDYDKINVGDLNKIVMNVCNPSEIVSKKSDQIAKIIGNRCVIFYRGNDKSKEIKAIPYDDYVNMAKSLNENSFFVQTDEQEFYDYFKRKFPDTKCGILPMIKKNQNSAIRGNDGIKSEFAINYLATTCAIAKARKIILPTGNTGMWVVIYRGNLDGVHQLKGDCSQDMYCSIN